MGGAPERTSPHYFVLGSSPWFQNLARDMDEVRIPISRLPAQCTSFTYPDSFTAMGLIADYGLPYEAQPYHNQVFMLSSLPNVIESYGMPKDDTEAMYDGYHRRVFEKYVEIQLWSDEPIREY